MISSDQHPPAQHRIDLAMAIIPALASWLIRILRWSMRLDYRNRHFVRHLDAQGKNYILAFLHGQLLLMPYSYAGQKMVILISRHRDGEFIARTMGKFGHAAVRGSSNRGAAGALKSLVRQLRQGMDAGITPDGPRGPRGVVQPGILQAARLSGAPIIPVVFSANRSWQLKSWDRFLIPKPFSRGTFTYGEPIHVPRSMSGTDLEAVRRHLEEQLARLATQPESGNSRLDEATGAS